MKTIPIVHCFDYKYIIPASVCFHSLLRHGNRDCFYQLLVIGSGLTPEHCEALQAVVRPFPNASLEIIEAPKLDLPDGGEVLSANLSKDVFYKMLIPEIFPQYDRIIVSDVDIVYTGDTSGIMDFLPEDDDAYFAGIPDPGYAVWRNEGILRTLGTPKSFHRYDRFYTKEMKEKLWLNTGYMVLNAKKMRADKISQKCMAYANANFKRLVLLDQDVLNIICFPHLRAVPPQYMAFALYRKFYNELTAEQRSAAPEWDAMFAKPLLLHYVSGLKPWKYPASQLAEVWFDNLIDCGLFDQWRISAEKLAHPYEHIKKRRQIWKGSIPFTLHPLRKFVLTISKDTYETAKYEGGVQ
ncbi:MAG: glycosyltransferase family 8 protein [Kiritimatiellia bacterium]